ncbi:MAG TPA: hypothetical protein P5191_15195 [Ruminococcus sp.]|nr:hypothetical protein [Ruminococcus sp.]
MKSKLIPSTPETGSSSSDSELKPFEKASKDAFSTRVYDEINSKIGGNNPDQFLCLLIPGLILYQDDYKYDLKTDIKGPVIEANESRLANKMFDPYQMTNTDNGRALSYQYKMALDMLTQKINKKLALHKNKLRRLLISPYPYDFGDGIESKYTLQEVYFKLYDEYMDELYEWKKVIARTKEELKKQHNSDDDFENAYLEWYEDNAGDYLDKINEKKAKVLSVFSPNDMKILEGVLDSDSGAELQEARQNLYNLRKITPNGSYIYPISFEPKNWFEMIGTSFTPAELTESPEKITESIQRLSLRRLSLYYSIYDISVLVKNDLGSKEVNAKMESSMAARKEIERYSAKQLNMSNAFKVLIPALEIRSKAKSSISERALKKLISGAFLTVEEKDIPGILSAINNTTRKTLNVQDQFLEQSKELTEKLIKRIEEEAVNKNKPDSYASLLKPIQREIENLDTELEKLYQKLNVSTAIHENISDDALTEELISPTPPKGFTRIEFQTDASTLDKVSEYSSSVSNISSGISFLFNGRKMKSTSSSSSLDSLASSDTIVQISMDIAKVGIVREWFNPGIFSLTGDMFRLSETRIAPESDDINDKLEKRLERMRGTIFPCYPVSMVLARDIQIKFKYKGTLSEEERVMFERHASSNGSFLFFSGRDEHGKSDAEGVHTYFSDQTVTLKFDTTQIIGYYLQATPADKSTFLSDSGKDDSSMADFSENYRQIIENNLKKQPL